MFHCYSAIQLLSGKCGIKSSVSVIVLYFPPNISQKWYQYPFLGAWEMGEGQAFPDIFIHIFLRLEQANYLRKPELLLRM